MMLEQSSINESFLQSKLQHIKTRQYIMENLYVFDWESDFLLKTTSGYYYEYEIKISVSDFKHDFSKKEKHLILQNGEIPRYTYRYVNGVQTVVDEKRIQKKRPNYFYYVVPWFILDGIRELLPSYAGLLCLLQDGTLSEIRRAPKLHSDKYTDESLKLCEKFYYNWRNAKDFKDTTIVSKNNEIKRLRNHISLLEAEFEATTGFKFSECL